MGFFQYLRDTKGELRYVAWPTRLQTIVYTVLVILLSILVALYLGLFDFIFTTGLRNTLEVLPQRSAPSVSLDSTRDKQLGTSTPQLTITQTPVSTSTSITATTTL